jgi:hypothetical protein
LSAAELGGASTRTCSTSIAPPDKKRGPGQRNAAPGARGGAPQHRLDEHRNIVAPLAQRGQRDLDDAEPIKQIFTEPGRLHLAFRVAVRRRDDPGVYANRLVSAQPFDGALLHAQQLGLHRRRDVDDFVEKQRPAGGGLETPDTLRDCVGERAFLEPEEFRFEQRLRDRGAIDGNEWRALARAE